MVNDVLIGALSWLLIGVFGQAIYHKSRSWLRFCAALQAYEVAPANLTQLLAVLALTGEVVVVLGLLLAPGFALLGAALLLTMYGAAISLNVLRGRGHIDCGCGDEPTPVSWWLVLRNGLLAVSAVGGALHLLDDGALVQGLHSGLSFCAALVAFLLYSAFNQLAANRARYLRHWAGTS